MIRNFFIILFGILIVATGLKAVSPFGNISDKMNKQKKDALPKEKNIEPKSPYTLEVTEEEIKKAEEKFKNLYSIPPYKPNNFENRNFYIHTTHKNEVYVVDRYHYIDRKNPVAGYCDKTGCWDNAVRSGLILNEEYIHLKNIFGNQIELVKDDIKMADATLYGLELQNRLKQLEKTRSQMAREELIQRAEAASRETIVVYTDDYMRRRDKLDFAIKLIKEKLASINSYKPVKVKFIPTAEASGLATLTIPSTAIYYAKKKEDKAYYTLMAKYFKLMEISGYTLKAKTVANQITLVATYGKKRNPINHRDIPISDFRNISTKFLRKHPEVSHFTDPNFGAVNAATKHLDEQEIINFTVAGPRSFTVIHNSYIKFFALYAHLNAIDICIRKMKYGEYRKFLNYTDYTPHIKDEILLLFASKNIPRRKNKKIQ
jgi:hypothetical protein